MNSLTNKLVYVASPLSHTDPEVRERRYELVRDYIGRQYEEGSQDMYYSPIMYCHEIGKLFKLPHDAAFWKNMDHLMLEKADKLEILMLDGWEESIGVKGEIEHWENFLNRKTKAIIGTMILMMFRRILIDRDSGRVYF